MKTRRKYYVTKKQTSSRSIIISRDGLASIQPTVRLVRIQLPSSPPNRRAGRSNRAKVVHSSAEQTDSKLVKVKMPTFSPKRPGSLKKRGRQKKYREEEETVKSERRMRKDRRDRERYRQIEELQRKIARSETSESSQSDQSEPNYQIPPILKNGLPKNQKIKDMVKKSDSQTHETVDIPPNVIHNCENDFVMYGIDVYKKCYAVKVFPTPFDPKECTYKEYVNTSVDKATKLCHDMSLGMININRRPEISECNDISPKILANITDSIKFGEIVSNSHPREKRLRDLNGQIQEALKYGALKDCTILLDELKIFLSVTVPPVTKLHLKKQPRIVCTILDLISKPIESPHRPWLMIRNIAVWILLEIKRIFGFTASDRDFKNWFLLELKLFNDLTKHLTARERHEIIEDPVETVELAERPVYV